MAIMKMLLERIDCGESSCASEVWDGQCESYRCPIHDPAPPSDGVAPVRVLREAAVSGCLSGELLAF